MSRQQQVAFVLGALAIAGLSMASCGNEVAEGVPIPEWAKVAPEQIAEAKKHGVPVAFENDLGMRFVLIPAGTFRLADPGPGVEPASTGETSGNGEKRLGKRLKPLRAKAPGGEATVARPFYMQVTEVTGGQYVAVLRGSPSAGHDGSGGDASRSPVAGLSREAAKAFAERIGCRLPTEAEWDRAAQGGVEGQAFPWGAEDDAALRNGPGAEDGYERRAPVASYPPNGYGLYDVLGNVWEYCSDKVVLEGIGAVDALPVLVVQTEEQRAAEGEPPKTSPLWIIRGGSWKRGSEGAGTSSRAISSPYRIKGEIDVGFRLVSPLPEKGE